MKRNPSQDFLLFLLGGALFSAGLFLFTSQVMVSSGYVGSSFGGTDWRSGHIGRFSSWVTGFFPMGTGQGSGLLMIPFGLGVGLLLADTLKKLGWFLIMASSAALGAGILQSLLLNFRPTSLFSLLGMVAMIAGGGGLMLRAVRAYEKEQDSQAPERNSSTGRDEKDVNKELEGLKAKIRRRRFGR
jgi:hypothetical protein